MRTRPELSGEIVALVGWLLGMGMDEPTIAWKLWGREDFRLKLNRWKGGEGDGEYLQTPRIALAPSISLSHDEGAAR